MAHHRFCFCRNISTSGVACLHRLRDISLHRRAYSPPTAPLQLSPSLPPSLSLSLSQLPSPYLLSAIDNVENYRPRILSVNSFAGQNRKREAVGCFSSHLFMSDTSFPPSGSSSKRDSRSTAAQKREASAAAVA